MAINPDKVHEFVNKAVGDLGAAIGAALVVIGDKLGLYKGLKEGPATSEELAKRTGTAERYVREWLAAQAAAGYVELRCQGRTLLPHRGAGGVPDERGEPRLRARRLPEHGLRRPHVAEGDGGLPQRQGRGLARARAGPLPRHRTLLPSRLQREPSELVDPRARRRSRTARGGRQRRRRRLRAWRVDDHPRPRRFRSQVSRIRLPSRRRSTRRTERARRSRSRRPRDASRWPPPKTIRVRTIWSRSSIACTTWATPSAPPRTCANRSSRTARGCSSSRSPATAWRTT